MSLAKWVPTHFSRQDFFHLLVFSVIIYPMSSWSTKRQFTYAGITFLVFLFIFTGIAAKILYKPATCSDGKKNGTEEDIDCGGSCAKLCSMQTIPPIILWQRISNVSHGLYNAIAYVENSNPNAIARDIPYEFKLYDKNGVVIAVKDGKTFLPANKVSPIFEGPINTGERTAERMTFEFTQSPNWQKQTVEEPKLALISKTLSAVDSLPRLDATMQNASIQFIKHADVIAILYNDKGNAIAFARSSVDNLAKGQNQNIFFTWREAFTAPVTRIEIVPRVSF